MKLPGGRRGLLIASPFVLLAIGFGVLITSPWPAIWALMHRGQHVLVPYGWSTWGRLVLAIACFVGALGVSFNIKRRP